MHGLLLQGTEQIEFHRDLPEPVIESATDVIVRVERAGICGSDLHQYHGREQVAPATIPGHEFCGEVVAAGADVRRWRVGERVFSPFTTCCGGCFFCRSGLSARCDRGQMFGYRDPGSQLNSGGLHGAQADLVRVPLADHTLMAMPEPLSAAEAILLGDNFTTGYYCASRGQIDPAGVTVVIGCGAVGLSAIVAARFLGAEQIVAVDLVTERRRRAAQLGATAVSPDEAADTVKSQASRDGRGGADTILEAVGLPPAQQLSFSLVRPGGTISSVGVPSTDRFAFSPVDAYDRNLVFAAGRCPVRSCLDLLLPEIQAGRLTIPVAQIVTEEAVPLAAGAEAYRRFASRSQDCVKLLLQP